ESQLAQRNEQLLRANRSYKMLSCCNHALIHADDENALLHDICKIIFEDGHYPFVWVGLAQHDDQKRVLLVASAGADQDYVNSLNVSWAEDRWQGSGPVGRAIRARQPIIAQDLQA